LSFTIEAFLYNSVSTDPGQFLEQLSHRASGTSIAGSSAKRSSSHTTASGKVEEKSKLIYPI